MGKKWSVLAAVGVVAAGALAGCGSGSSGSSNSSSGSSKTITVWIGGQMSEQKSSWQQLFDEYTKQTGVKVVPSYFGLDGYYDKVITAFKAGNPPDVAFADVAWTSTLGAAGFVDQLDSQVNAWNGAKDIIPSVWGGAKYDGHYYGVPWYADVRTLLYNRDLFKQAGLDPNSPPKTWQELLTDAQKITALGHGIYGYGVSGAKSEVTAIAIEDFLWDNGVNIVSDDGKKSELNTPQAVQALTFYTDLYKKYHVSPLGTVSLGEDDYRNMLAQGKLGMAFGGPWSFPLLANVNANLNYGVAPVPTPDGSVGPSVMGGWNFVIAKTSSNQSADWDFVKFMSSTSTQEEWVKQNGGPMPVVQSAINQFDQFKQPKWQAVLTQFNKAKVRPPVPQYPQISDALVTMVQSVLSGQATPAQAVSTANDAINQALSAQ